MEDHFHDIEFIGSGLYGSVYRATDNWTRKLVSVKSIHSDVLRTASNRELEALEGELRFLSAAPHGAQFQRFLRGPDAGDGTLPLFVVGDYYENNLHQQILSSGRFHTAQIQANIRALCECLKACHSSGLPHGEVKPSNLLKNQEEGTQGRRVSLYKLSDLGYRRCFAVPPNRFSTTTVDTSYKAPELLQNPTGAKDQHDIWAAGCVFAEMATGNVLFPGNLGAQVWNGAEILKKVQEVPSIGGIAKDLLRKMLELDPRRRITAEQALDHAYFHQIYIDGIFY